MMAGRFLVVAIVAGWAASGVARDAGVIRGRVSFAAMPRPADRPLVSDLSSQRHAPIDRRRAVVYLDPAPRPAFEDLPAGRARLDQKGEQFAPRVLAITAGTTVDFPNNDVTFHNVFSLSPVKPFDLGRYRPGRTGWVKFDRPGIVSVFCDIHAHMSAFILIFNHPYFAVTDDDGRYAITGAPAGTHTLMVWSELGQAPPRRVTVVDGEPVEADFRIGRQLP